MINFATAKLGVLIGFLFLLCLYELGLSGVHLFLLSFIAAFCVFLSAGIRWLLRAAIVMLFLAIAIHLGMLPPTASWQVNVGHVVHASTANAAITN